MPAGGCDQHQGHRRPIVLMLPIRTINPCNTREHWAVRANRHAAQRRHAVIAMLDVDADFRKFKRPKAVAITLCRIGKRKMDTDGLAASFKAVRDGIAESFEIDDGSDFYRWNYTQEIGKEYAVRITIEERK